MNRIIIVLGLVWIAVATLGAIEVSGGKCAEPYALTTDYSQYFAVGAMDTDELEISFVPDATGSETQAVIGLDFCSREAINSCQAYNFDTDADGLGDTNLLDGSTIEKAGRKGISGFLYLRIYAATNPSGTDEPEFTVCRVNH